nr:GGDEF domain-containing protein [uncultured Devosia sp.]
MVGLNIVIASILGLLALLCAVASLALRRNVPLAWLAGALAVGTVQTLFLTFAPGTVLEFASAMVLAPFGFWLANNTIYALMPEKRWRWGYLAGFIGLCAIAVALTAAGAPFFYQVFFVQLACTLAMFDAALRIMSGMKWWRVLDVSLLITVGTLALVRLARLPLLVWYFGLDVDFPAFNGSSLELALLAVESLVTLGIITLVISSIIADTIATFQQQSERDGPTGLLNRRAVDAMAAQRSPAGGAVIFCDIDHFKQVNDRYGHQAGDAVIQAFAAIIERTGHHAARIGGEEFALLLPGASVQQAEGLADMIRLRFNEMIHLALAADDRLSASFGIAEYAAGEPPASAFVRADAALYRAKEAGRNRVEICPEAERQGRSPNRRTQAA